MLVRKWTAIRDAMNIADGRQLKTGSALFNAYQMFSSKSAQEVVTQKKKIMLFLPITNYRMSLPC